MSGRLLDFSQYLGGADNVITLELFPRSQKIFTYNFDEPVTDYIFTGDYQSLLLDQVTYDRNTGLPNFADTLVFGSFDNYTQIDGANFDKISVANKCVFVIPSERYTGKVFPNARQNVVATVVSFEWQKSAGALEQKNTHRYVILERWEPGVEAGDPTTNTAPIFSSL